MAERNVTYNLKTERESCQDSFFFCIPHKCAYATWQTSSRQYISAHARCSRPGAAPPATKITWPDGTRFSSYEVTLRTVVLPPVPHELPELRRRIVAAISQIDRDMLQRVWAEMGYRLDMCRVAKGGHTEHLWGNKIIWRQSLPICRSHVTILAAIKV